MAANLNYATIGGRVKTVSTRDTLQDAGAAAVIARAIQLQSQVTPALTSNETMFIRDAIQNPVLVWQQGWPLFCQHPSIYPTAGFSPCTNSANEDLVRDGVTYISTYWQGLTSR